MPIDGVKHWLWRAVDANGDVPVILVQPQRKASTRFPQRSMDRFGEPRFVITDKLRSCMKPVEAVAPRPDHRADEGLSNRIEGSHRPVRIREKTIGRFKSPQQAQPFLSAHDRINTVLRPGRRRMSAAHCRQSRTDAFEFRNDRASDMIACRKRDRRRSAPGQKLGSPKFSVTESISQTVMARLLAPRSNT